MKLTNKKEELFIILIIVLGFFLRIYAINWQLPYLYQTEEYKTVNYTLKMAATKSLNPKFFEYPSLYLYFMLFVYGILFFIGKILGVYSSTEDFALKFFSDPTIVYVVGRVFSVVFGTFIIFLTYLLGKMLYNKRVGLIASLIISILPIWVVYSHYIKPEMFSNVLVIGYAIFLYKYYLTKNDKFFYFSCTILGLAISTKYLSAPSGVLLPIVYFSIKENKTKFINFIFGVIIIFIFFIIGTPYALLNYKTFFNEIEGILLGPQEGLKRNIFYGGYKTFINWIFMGNFLPNIGILCFLGIIYCIMKRKFQDLILLSIFLVYSLINIT
ncbi:MAG: glycosyltransferase family 39 protein, partial [Endomicrobia bacterium]|nr:glycosyltransferase family 39 protein [Endomicrobiia bacterium]